MKLKNYYKILGVKRTASADDIKKAFYELARKFHPDKNENADSIDKFNEINEAYRILGNLDERLKYSIILRQREDLIEQKKINAVFEKKKK